MKLWIKNNERPEILIFFPKCVDYYYFARLLE